MNDRAIKDEIQGYIKTNHSDEYIEAKIWGKWCLNYSIERVSELIEIVKKEMQYPDRIDYQEEPENFELININKGSIDGVIYAWCSPVKPDGWCGWIKI